MQEARREQLINAVETSFVSAPFWLGAHRYTANALKALGHQVAQMAVIAELAAFLHRFPELLEYSFREGSGFADPDTRDWIDQHVLGEAEVNNPQAHEHTTRAHKDEPWVEVYQEAMSLGRGKFNEGARLFQHGRQQTRSAKERFLWDLHQARYCQAIGHIEVAIHLLESLDDQATHYHLEEWEPERSFEIAELLLNWYQKAKAKSTAMLTSERESRRQQLRARISRIDVAKALEKRLI